MTRLSFLADRVLPSSAFVAGLAVIGDGAATDAMVIWAMRGFVTLCLALITYFLKKMVDDAREANKKRDDNIAELRTSYATLVKLTAAHEVMYEIWLEQLTAQGHPENGTRKTDQIHKAIMRLSQENK